MEPAPQAIQGVSFPNEKDIQKGEVNNNATPQQDTEGEQIENEMDHPEVVYQNQQPYVDDMALPERSDLKQTLAPSQADEMFF